VTPDDFPIPGLLSLRGPSTATAAYRGNSDVDLKRFEDAADMLCDMATLQGLAHLVLEEKAAHFFRKATPGSS
jgi:hypothetical protein